MYMNLTTLSTILTKLFNNLGNKYLTDNFVTEPFEFVVKVRYGDNDEYHKYVADVYTKPAMPESFNYKPEIKKEKIVDGIDISVFKYQLRQMIEYTGFRGTDQTGINFVNKDNW